MAKDRFKIIAKNYGKLFPEVLSLQGYDYQELQESVLKTVSKMYPNYKTAKILDIGTGDGATIAPFVRAGCKNLTGIDLNPEMLDASFKRFGDKVKLIQADATNMHMFKPNYFDVITTATCIHNIPRNQRKSLWCELLRLNPKFFVAAEKIVDPNPIKHKQYHNSEVNAILKVFKEKYNLPVVAREWVKHYEYDEREKMTLEEIKNMLGNNYNINVVYEQGVNKVISAVSKK
jgi:ubiquinone/menaquinone biosynthesis C-methylase UbiE